MKKLLLVVLLLVICNIEMMSQTERRKLHDVSVVYGFAPLTDRGFWRPSYTSVGIFSVQYVINASDKFGIGVVAGYQHFSHRYDDYTANDWTGMIVLRAKWINKPDFSLYSKAGIGVCFMNDNDNVIENNRSFAIQVPSIGITYNLYKEVFCLAEFSLLSSQGMFMFGAGYSF